jgi:hypothetical protein
MTEFARQNGAAQCDDLFPATQGKHGKKFVWAQNRQNSSQIDPCNQALIRSFPLRLAGRKFSLPGCRQGNHRENSHSSRESIRSMAKKGLWIIHLRTYLGLFRRCRAGNFAGSPARPAAGRTDRPYSSRRRHFATLLEIIRVNLDAKMAAPPSRRRRRRSGLFAQLDNSLIYRSSSEQQKAARCRR